MIDTASPRVVPGAPSAPSLSKSQLKKMRKAKAKTDESAPETPVEIPDPTASALIEKAPAPSDIQEGSVAPELVAEQSEQDSSKASPIVELINKRLKASNKKITRISSYATADYDTLNDDQKRSLKTLPTLEAIVKELNEVKKAIEVHEGELAKDLQQRQQGTEALERQRISEAITQAQDTHISLTLDILSFIRVRNDFWTGERDPLSYGVTQREVEVINAVGSVLLGDDTESRRAVIKGLLSKAKSFEDISYERLLEISQQVIVPRSPSPVHAPAEELSVVASEQPVANGVPPSKSGSSFHFLQESEIETPSFEQSAEWVEHPTSSQQSEDLDPDPQNISEHKGNRCRLQVPTSGEPIDWAAEGEDDLPSIDGLHATFGKSGSVTPDAQADPISHEQPPSEANGLHGSETVPLADDDGFTQARGGRGRGRGFRGGERGGFRGGSRGGDRGSFKGGERGHRGGFRGMELSSFIVTTSEFFFYCLSGGRGRGDWRGDGEHRGRGGRGRGRGGDRGGGTFVYSDSSS
ncbi:hypothetical protein L218DRAFT_1048167 [Marasmius fiardii PR-910]|nr:hypothetical protein L218DRAFT_1048167 [Marasmius fiardii PR-910]